MDNRRSKLRRAIAWLRHWVPFAARTAYYGSISLVAGPLTRERRACAWAMRAWSRSCLRFLRISVDLAGLENIPSGPHAYACNHQSLLDTLLLGASLPDDFKWAVKSSLLAIPFLGWHLRLAGHVQVDRGGDKRAAAATVDRFAGILRRGQALLVFPEGTRSRDGHVKAFKRGLFYAAARAGVPVVPLALHGTGNAMAKGAADLGPSSSDHGEWRRVYVRIGAPLLATVDGSETERASDLRDRTRAAVVEMHRALAAAAGQNSSGS